MPDLSPDTRRKLAGVLGMLGSDYAGAPRPPSGWRELARRCAAYPEWLSPWERQFVAGLGRWGRLSSKQAATLDRIALKLRSRGREPGPSDAL